MPIKPSGTLTLTEIATEYRDTTPYSVSDLASLTEGLTSGSLTRFSDFYGKSSAFTPRTYSQDHVMSVYFESVDREVYWLIDIRSMGSRWYTHWSDFYFTGFTYNNPNLPGISQPELYSSVSIDVAGSSGRSIVAVTQQPTAGNGWIGVAYMNDNAPGSRGPYLLRLNITATSPSGLYTQPNLWFDRTVIDVPPYGGSQSVTASFHPKVIPISFSWSIDGSYVLSNANSQTVTVTNPTDYAGVFGAYNIIGSSLTCTAVLRYNNINYTVTKTIYVHTRVY